MTNDTEAILDDLLCKWAQWLRPLKVGHGFDHQAPGCGQYRTSRQYHDGEMQDEDIDHGIMKQVDYEISQIPQPENDALHHEGVRLVGDESRNRRVGVNVFKTPRQSPRLPTDPEELRKLTVRAKGMLVVRLGNAGVM